MKQSCAHYFLCFLLIVLVMVVLFTKPQSNSPDSHQPTAVVFENTPTIRESSMVVSGALGNYDVSMISLELYDGTMANAINAMLLNKVEALANKPLPRKQLENLNQFSPSLIQVRLESCYNNIASFVFERFDSNDTSFGLQSDYDTLTVDLLSGAAISINKVLHTSDATIEVNRLLRQHSELTSSFQGQSNPIRFVLTNHSLDIVVDDTCASCQESYHNYRVSIDLSHLDQFDFYNNYHQEDVTANASKGYLRLNLPRVAVALEEEQELILCNRMIHISYLMKNGLTTLFLNKSRDQMGLFLHELQHKLSQHGKEDIEDRGIYGTEDIIIKATIEEYPNFSQLLIVLNTGNYQEQHAMVYDKELHEITLADLFQEAKVAHESVIKTDDATLLETIEFKVQADGIEFFSQPVWLEEETMPLHFFLSFQDFDVRLLSSSLLGEYKINEK